MACNTPNQYLIPTVRSRVELISESKCREWGGEIREGTPTVTRPPTDTSYHERTVVGSESDGLAAFKKYTDFHEFVLESGERTEDKVVLLPCGAQKPIGSSSIHSKKLNALSNAGLTDDADIAIMSEPCTIIPHDMRLSLPAVNYDFPPKYTEEESAPAVFDVFAERIAEWIDEREYETIYIYLVNRHENKFWAALEQAQASPEVITIPGASISIETGNYSGDLFKSEADITMKLRAIEALRGNESAEAVPEELMGRYAEKLGVDT